MNEPFTDDELSRIKHETYQAFGEHIRVRTDVFQRVLTELQEARAENAWLREELAWYADTTIWIADENNCFMNAEHKVMSLAEFDGGARARQALRGGE